MKVKLGIDDSIAFASAEAVRDVIDVQSLSESAVLATTVVHDFMNDQLDVRTYIVTEATPDEIRSMMQSYTTGMLYIALKPGLTGNGGRANDNDL